MSNKPPKRGIIDPAVLDALKQTGLPHEFVQTKRHWRVLLAGRQVAVVSRGNSKQEWRRGLTSKTVSHIERLARELAA